MIRTFVAILLILSANSVFSQDYWYRVFVPPDTLEDTAVDTIEFDETFANAGDMVVAMFVDVLSGTVAGSYYVDYSIDFTGSDWVNFTNGSFAGTDETIVTSFRASVDSDPIYQRVRVRYSTSGTHSTEIRTKVLFKGR